MEGRISYVKKQWARHSIESLFAGILAAGLWSGAVSLAVRTNGSVPLYGAAMAFCGFLMALAGMILGVMALFDKDKKYLFARIGLLLGAMVAIASIVMTVI